jgi:hypothetical protein
VNFCAFKSDTIPHISEFIKNTAIKEFSHGLVTCKIFSFEKTLAVIDSFADSVNHFFRHVQRETRLERVKKFRNLTKNSNSSPDVRDPTDHLGYFQMFF